MDLRPAGDARLDVESTALTGGVPLDLVGECGTWADQAHVAAHDVPQLRQLVDRQAAEDAAGASDARVALVDSETGTARLGADLHRAQLQELELVAVQADAPLSVEDRAAVGELDRDGGDGERRTRERETDSRCGDVERAVHRVPSAFAQTAGTPKRR